MYALGVTNLPAVNAATGLTAAEELDAICRFQPCGTALCPCPPGVQAGQMPGLVPRLPELNATAPAPIPWALLALVAVGLLAAWKRPGRRGDW